MVGSYRGRSYQDQYSPVLPKNLLGKSLSYYELDRDGRVHYVDYQLLSCELL